MTTYEIVSLIVSLVAVVIALVSLVRTRKVASQQIELERVTAELSAKQLDILNAEEKSLSKAQIDVELEGFDSDYHFIITNVGGAEARNVTFKIEGEENPLIESEYQDKIPIPSLRPGKSIQLIAALDIGSSSKYNAVVSWQDPDGSAQHDEFFLAL